MQSTTRQAVPPAAAAACGFPDPRARHHPLRRPRSAGPRQQRGLFDLFGNRPGRDHLRPRPRLAGRGRDHGAGAARDRFPAGVALARARSRSAPRSPRSGAAPTSSRRRCFSDGECAAIGRATMVLIDRETRRSRPLPPELIERLEEAELDRLGGSKSRFAQACRSGVRTIRPSSSSVTLIWQDRREFGRTS